MRCHRALVGNICPLLTAEDLLPVAVRSNVGQLWQGEASRLGHYLGMGVSMMAKITLLHGPVTAKERVSRPRPEHVNPFEACLLHPAQLLG